MCSAVLAPQRVRLQRRIVEEHGPAVLVEVPLGDRLAGVRRFNIDTFAEQRTGSVVALSPRSRATNWTARDWYVRVRNHAASQPDPQLGPEFGRARHQLAVDMLARLICLRQNARHALLRDIPDRPLRDCLERAARCLRAGAWVSSIYGLAYGPSASETALPDMGDALWILSGESPVRTSSSTTAGRIQLPILGAFDWGVRGTGGFFPLHFGSPAAPPFPAHALAHRCGTFGTLGGVIRLAETPNELYGLTCAHVVLCEPLDGKGTPVFRWKDALKGWEEWSVLHDWANSTACADDPVDAAIVGPLPKSAHADAWPVLDRADFQPTRLKQSIYLHGAGSGHARATVGLIGKAKLPQLRAGAWCTNMFLDLAFCPSYTASGDSGAIVRDEATDKPVGLHLAGNEHYSVFQPLRRIAEEFAFA